MTIQKLLFFWNNEPRRKTYVNVQYLGIEVHTIVHLWSCLSVRGLFFHYKAHRWNSYFASLNWTTQAFSVLFTIYLTSLCVDMGVNCCYEQLLKKNSISTEFHNVSTPLKYIQVGSVKLFNLQVHVQFERKIVTNSDLLMWVSGWPSASR